MTWSNLALKKTVEFFKREKKRGKEKDTSRKLNIKIPCFNFRF